MANEIEQIYIDGTTYPVADATAREEIETLKARLIADNKLSDYEAITIGEGVGNPTTMEYDGFLFLETHFDGRIQMNIFVNGVTQGVGTPGNVTVPVNKGDKVALTFPAGSKAAWLRSAKARFYKNRVYE